MNNFVISLSTATKRREHISSEFKKQNTSFTFFDAITPETMDGLVQELGLDLSATELKKSEIACLLSHVALWHKAVVEDMPYIAIFEDDIHLGNSANKFLMNYEWLDDSKDIVKLEGFYKHIGVKKDFPSLTANDRQLLVLAEKHMGCGGYILSKNAASKLLNILKKYEKLIPVDHIVFNDFMHTEQMNIYQVVPALCIQDHKLCKSHQNFPSYLENDRNIRKGEKLYRPKLNFFQKVRREIMRVINKVSALFIKDKNEKEGVKMIKLDFK